MRVPITLSRIAVHLHVCESLCVHILVLTFAAVYQQIAVSLCGSRMEIRSLSFRKLPTYCVCSLHAHACMHTPHVHVHVHVHVANTASPLPFIMSHLPPFLPPNNG